MNVIFALYEGMHSNSAIHVVNLVRYLEEMGINCLILVPRDVRNHSLDTSQVRIVSSNDINLIEEFSREFRGTNIFHAWTPREAVRRTWELTSRKIESRLIIHLEDNEEELVKRTFDKPLEKYLRAYFLGIPDYLSHPRHYRSFIRSANGCTVVIEKLEDFIPKNIPRYVIWPGVDHDLFGISEDSKEFRSKLGLKSSNFVLVYTGNVHLANVYEVRSIYRAIKILRSEGFPATLLRTGTDSVSPYSPDLADIQEFIINLGRVAYDRVPEVLSCGDLLVQPGKPDEFNNYRFPSKLPEYLAMGKPVILPKANIGLHLKDMEEAIIRENVDARAIADAAKLISSDDALHDRLGQGARAFAVRELNWRDRTIGLLEFYKSILAK